MKTNPLLIALGFQAGDTVLAERLLDWCFELNGRQPLDHPIVLMAAPNVHPELQMKVRLAAEVAFSQVELVVVGGQIGDKVDGSNRLFKAGAHAAMNSYRSPWLWLEPDCVPLKKSWLADISEAYYKQPKRFFGPHAKFMAAQDEKTCVVRVAVYPNNAAIDLTPYCDLIAPFNQVAAEVIVTRSTKARLIQQLEVRGKEDLDKIRPDAVLLHSDKTGVVVEVVRNLLAAEPPKPDLSKFVVPVLHERPAGEVATKVDGRSKAAREKRALTTV